MCIQRGVLYLAWTMAAPAVREKYKQAYADHLHTCPACRRELDADREVAARQPERLPIDDLVEAGR